MGQQDKLMILEDGSIRRKITRMAYEMVENHLESKGEGSSMGKSVPSRENNNLLKFLCS